MVVQSRRPWWSSATSSKVGVRLKVLRQDRKKVRELYCSLT